MPDIDPEIVCKLRLQLVIHDEFEARYWARTLGLTRTQVREAFGELEAKPVDAEEALLANANQHTGAD